MVPDTGVGRPSSFIEPCFGVVKSHWIYYGFGFRSVTRYTRYTMTQMDRSLLYDTLESRWIPAFDKYNLACLSYNQNQPDRSMRVLLLRDLQPKNISTIYRILLYKPPDR
jgi:hypothetical protein